MHNDDISFFPGGQEEDEWRMKSEHRRGCCSGENEAPTKDDGSATVGVQQTKLAHGSNEGLDGNVSKSSSPPAPRIRH